MLSPAHADDALSEAAKRYGQVREAVDQLRDMHAALDVLGELSYALVNNPEELQYLPSMIYGDILRFIESDPVLSAELHNLEKQYSGGYAQVSGSAGVSSDLEVVGAGTASVDASYELPLCTVAGVNAMGLAGYEDHDALASWALGGTACLPLPANTLQISYTRRNNVRGSLLRRPVAFRDRRTEDVVTGLIRFWRWDGDHNRIDVGPISFDVVATESEDGMSGIGGQTGSFTAAPVDWRRKGKGLAGGDMVLTFFKVNAFFHSDDSSIGGRYTSTAAVIPLALDGVRITDHVALGADFGYGAGSVYDSYAASAANGNTGAPPPPPLVDRHIVHFEGWTDLALPAVAAQLKVGHTLMPAYGGQLLLEDRVSARAEMLRERAAVRGEAFIGRTRVVRIKEDEHATLFGGAADVAYAIMPDVHAVGRVEVARSIVAGLDTEPLRVEREVRATVGVTAEFARRW